MSTELRRPVVAVFDFDGTITVADTLLPFLRETVGRWGFWWRMLLLAPVLGMFALRLIRESTAKKLALRLFVRHWSRARLREASRRFVAGRLQPLINPRAMSELRTHRGRGDRLVVLSASPEIYIREWAAQHGIAEIVATRLEVVDGRYTGQLDGLNCRGVEKVRRLAEHLGSLEEFEVHAYGDSPADWKLLDCVEHPHYRAFDTARGLGRNWTVAQALLKGLL
jgi:HAD superfamily hydrolase (TIGR01490 family)